MEQNKRLDERAVETAKEVDETYTSHHVWLVGLTIAVIVTCVLAVVIGLIRWYQCHRKIASVASTDSIDSREYASSESSGIGSTGVRRRKSDTDSLAKLDNAVVVTIGKQYLEDNAFA